MNLKQNEDFVDEWNEKEVPIVQESKPSTCAKNENNADDIQHAADLQVDLVHQKSNIVIAFVETDVRNDFYLFNVTSKGTEVLESNLIDDMDVHMPRTPVFHGFLFELVNATDMVYSLIKYKKANGQCSHNALCCPRTAHQNSTREEPNEFKLTLLQPHGHIISIVEGLDTWTYCQHCRWMYLY